MACKLVFLAGALLMAACAACAQEVTVPPSAWMPAGSVFSGHDLIGSIMGVPEQARPLPANAYRGTYVSGASRAAAGRVGPAARLSSSPGDGRTPVHPLLAPPCLHAAARRATPKAHCKEPLACIQPSGAAGATDTHGQTAGGLPC
jgi:hypothetical protein